MSTRLRLWQKSLLKLAVSHSLGLPDPPHMPTLTTPLLLAHNARYVVIWATPAMQLLLCYMEYRGLERRERILEAVLAVNPVEAFVLSR